MCGELNSDPGYYTPYAQFLEGELEEIDGMLTKLLLAHAEGKPLDRMLKAIEKWMGDDWHWKLSDAEMKRLEKAKGWK